MSVDENFSFADLFKFSKNIFDWLRNQEKVPKNNLDAIFILKWQKMSFKQFPAFLVKLLNDLQKISVLFQLDFPQKVELWKGYLFEKWLHLLNQ